MISPTKMWIHRDVKEEKSSAREVDSHGQVTPRIPGYKTRRLGSGSTRGSKLEYHLVIKPGNGKYMKIPHV